MRPGVYLKGDVLFRAGKRCWSAVDDAALRLVFPHWPTAKLTRPFGRSVTAICARAKKLGVRKSVAYLASPDACRLRRGDNVGAPFRFQKGHVSANKGLRRPGWGPGRMKETQFKPGHRSNWMPIGSTRLCDGYLYVKVADVPRVPHTVNWFLLHVLEWERVHGPVPAGHCLSFKDGDPSHVDVDNLELLTRAERMRRNSVHNLPPSLARTIQLLGAVNRKLRKGRHEEQDRRPAESSLRDA